MPRTIRSGYPCRHLSGAEKRLLAQVYGHVPAQPSWTLASQQRPGDQKADLIPVHRRQYSATGVRPLAQRGAGNPLTLNTYPLPALPGPASRRRGRAEMLGRVVDQLPGCLTSFINQVDLSILSGLLFGNRPYDIHDQAERRRPPTANQLAPCQPALLRSSHARPPD